MLITQLRDFAMVTDAETKTGAAQSSPEGPRCPNVECSNLVIERIRLGRKCSTCGWVLQCLECGSPVTAGMRVCGPCSVLEEIEKRTGKL